MATFSFEPKKVALKRFWSKTPRWWQASVSLLGHTPVRSGVVVDDTHYPRNCSTIFLLLVDLKTYFGVIVPMIGC